MTAQLLGDRLDLARRHPLHVHLGQRAHQRLLRALIAGEQLGRETAPPRSLAMTARFIQAVLQTDRDTTPRAGPGRRRTRRPGGGPAGSTRPLRRPMGHREGAHRPPRLLLLRSLGLDPPNRIEHDAGRRDSIAIEPPDAHHAAPGSGGGEGRRVLEGEQRHLVAGHLWRCTSAASVKRSISLAFSHSSSSMRFPRILLSRGRFRDRCD